MCTALLRRPARAQKALCACELGYWAQFTVKGMACSVSIPALMELLGSFLEPMDSSQPKLDRLPWSQSLDSLLLVPLPLFSYGSRGTFSGGDVR